MPTSTMLRLKISATKKRLSDGIIPHQALGVIAISALVSIAACLVRVITSSGSFAVVPLEIPVASAPLIDRSVHGFREKPDKVMSKSTLAVVLTPKEFLFGDLSAFTTTSSDLQNKFVINHQDGSPQVNILLAQIDRWQDDRSRRLSLRSDGVLVLIPDSRIPMNIVIRVTKLLRDSHKFNSVVLAGGML